MGGKDLNLALRIRKSDTMPMRKDSFSLDSHRYVNPTLLTKEADIERCDHVQSKNGFYAITENGRELILAPKFADDIRNDKRLNFHTYREHVWGLLRLSSTKTTY
jgi:hypothetical protein